uniref:Glutathione synthetase n=1 Tax=Globodera pallida TaxID=36090 RepID=A0A183BTY5_GLOPA
MLYLVVFDEENVQTLVDDAIDYAHNVFLVARTSEKLDKSDYAQIVPFTLFPSPYPREMFKEAIDVAKAMSLLYFRVSRDFEFLKMVYKDVLELDESETIRNYMKICEEVLNEGIKQPMTIYLQRADYFVNVREDGAEKKYELKQIEVNGGSVGGANGIPTRIAKLHVRTLTKAGIPNLPEDVLPKNPNAKAGAAEALLHAWRLYKQKFTHSNPIIVNLVLKAKSYWHFLKRYDEYEIEQLSKNNVKVTYVAWGECKRDLTMDDDFTLRLKGQAVAVFYTNIVITGVKFTPQDLETLKMIERSTAIKSLSLFYELSVSKKVQQTLSLPGMVERFFPDPKEAPMVATRKTNPTK